MIVDKAFKNYFTHLSFSSKSQSTIKSYKRDLMKYYNIEFDIDNQINGEKNNEK